MFFFKTLCEQDLGNVRLLQLREICLLLNFRSFIMTCYFQEILASVMIKNLDTGEEIPLSLAEEKLPTGINPLTLHIMRRTKEYVR